MIRRGLTYPRSVKGLVTKKIEIISSDRIAQIPIP